MAAVFLVAACSNAAVPTPQIVYVLPTPIIVYVTPPPQPAVVRPTPMIVYVTPAPTVPSPSRSPTPTSDKGPTHAAGRPCPTPWVVGGPPLPTGCPPYAVSAAPTLSAAVTPSPAGVEAINSLAPTPSALPFTISSPTNGARFTTSPIVVSGTGWPGATVASPRSPNRIKVTENGQWQLSGVRLASGSNHIAFYQDGVPDPIFLDVSYVKPTP
jgi:hypothetical protein